MIRKWVRTRHYRSGVIGLTLLLAIVGVGVVYLWRASELSTSSILPVGLGPIALAADPTTGHVVVVNGSPMSISLLYALRGRILRGTTLPQPGEVEELAVDPRQKRLIVLAETPHGQSTIFLLDSQTLALVATVPSPYAVNVAVNPLNGRVFVFTRSSLDVIDDMTGKQLATIPLDAPRPYPLAGVIAIDTATNRVFVVAYDGLYMLNGTSGRILRLLVPTHTGESVVVDPALGHVIFRAQLDSGDTALMVSSRSGRLLRSTSIDGPGDEAGWQMVSVFRTHRVFILDSTDARLDVLDARSGRLLRAASIGQDEGPFELATDEPHRRVIILDRGPNSVLLLDDRSGVVQRRVPLTESPSTVAVDDVDGRIVVLESGLASSVSADPWAWMPAWLRDHLWFASRPDPGAMKNTITIIDDTAGVEYHR